MCRDLYSKTTLITLAIYHWGDRLSGIAGLYDSPTLSILKKLSTRCTNFQPSEMYENSIRNDILKNYLYSYIETRRPS